METLRDRLIADDRSDAIVDRRIKPALLALIADQAELVDADGDDYDLRTGFPDRRSVIEWYQKASVRTLGHIADDWPPIDCFAETETLLPALVRRRKWWIEPMDPGRAVTYRQFLEAVVVQPAFAEAYADLRSHAREYVEGDDDYESGPSDSDLKPGSQRNVAMRPGFQVLDRQQQAALDDLWGGFESRNDLLDWVHGLSAPSAGKNDSGLAEQILADDTAMDNLVWERDTPGAKSWREWFAAAIVLPYFVKAVNTIDTNELAESTSDTPTTMRMKGGN